MLAPAIVLVFSFGPTNELEEKCTIVLVSLFGWTYEFKEKRAR